MKRILSVAAGLCFMLFSMDARGQMTVSGTVTDEEGSSLPGVNVVEKGTSNGAVTDSNGEYSIETSTPAPVLVFTFIGLQTQEVPVNGRTTIDVVMQADVQQLSEVVVTALGIERQRNELPYAAQQVTSEQVTRTRNNNFVNALSGKVAGLDIKANNNLGGSTNVVVRGYKSITGNNQALFVIDGIPVSNMNTNTLDQQTGRVGTDFGNAAADINPDNIESINVLKGAAATALYGSRAANGVIMITTKKGRKDAFDVTINSGITWGTIDKTTYARYQKEYGGGYVPAFRSGDLGSGVGSVVLFDHDASFGPQFDPNLMVYQWDALDPTSPNFGKMRPWVAADNDPSDFYETSVSSNQNILVTGGGERTTFKLGYTRTDDKGVLPNSTLDKDLVNLSATFDLSDKLTVGASANYSRVIGIGRFGTGYNGNNPNQQFRQWWQTNVDIMEQKDSYFRTRRNITWNWADMEGSGPIYSDNPYWTRYENFANDSRDHTFGYITMNYKFTDWLDVLGRAGFDATADMQEERLAVGSAGTPSYQRFDQSFRETNFDLIANINPDLGDAISIRGLIGANLRRTRLSSIRASTNGGLIVPRLYALGNSRDPIQPPIEQFIRTGVDGIFANATVGLGDLVFVDLAARNDRSTTLPSENNSYFYWSAAASLVFSNLLDNEFMNHGKLRANYAEVGNDAPPLSLFDVYDKPTGIGSVPLFSLPNTKNNPNLRSERTKSFEAGIEVEFLESRFGFDFTWYTSSTFDQIIPVNTTSATGYTTRFVNSGEVRNQGIEISAFGAPVSTNNFTWRLGVTFARNRNEVVDLYTIGGVEVENILLGSFQGGITTNAAIGQPYGVLRGTDFVYTNGQPTVGANGIYLATPSSAEIIGDPNPDWIGGITNNLDFKSFSIYFLIDVRSGGDIFSLDQWYGEGTGLYANTVGLNEQGVPKRAPVAEGGGIILPGVKEDGTPNDIRGSLEDGIASAIGYPNSPPRAWYIYDGSYVKLREVTLSYSLPTAFVENLPAFKGIDLQLIGRNLWIIHKNMEYADPEETLSSGNRSNGYQSGAYPSVRTYGFNVRFRF